jgi:hypothetical protein
VGRSVVCLCEQKKTLGILPLLLPSARCMGGFELVERVGRGDARKRGCGEGGWEEEGR